MQRQHKNFFKRYSNILTKVKSLSKKLHFSAKIKKEQNNPRKIWKTFRSTIPASNDQPLHQPR